ncbi:MAG: restriction endonuclease subunit S [Roseivirga sp.]|uniref:restriction endonuclease subunit S n=1 Tax=Roseivirga sp. TaxID=1964215 RepID=UPI001B13EBBD|nr:restriction endonuclease subunit S [Roseivirga sp.]MBO6659571.1 restriction endonuclease subunit S [Roseivirga sp.]MBO6759864.1 restriction endonuclease subunit S [Roseivirga sp.]MBO6907692.1 restriction endonuclease subunit S [Roseivirga sp.]
MSDNFISTTIEEACEIHDSRRKPIKKGDRIEGKYPYYGASGIADYIRDYEFDGTYLLLSEDGDNLKTQKTPVAFLAKGKFWVNNHAHVLKAKEGNLTEYICYALQVADIKSYISGSTRPKITQSDMRMIPFNLPPLPEQKAIAHILGTLDDKIELNRQMNQTLEAMAQALFKSWFVDFDPVIDNALAAGNQIPEALQARAEKRKALLDRHSEGGTTEESPQKGAPLLYSNPALAALFPSSFEYNETLDKWIPEGWEVKSVGDLATVVGGGTPSTSVDEYYTDNGIAWLSPKDLSGYEWKYISKGAKDITELGLKKSSAKMMPSGTVVFSSRAPIGYVAIAENELCTNQGFKSLIPNKEVPSEYLYQFLKANVEQIESIASGSTFKEVSGSAIKGFSILKPSKEILARFAMIIESGNKKGLVNQKETETLTQLRDTLLPQLISGKVRVPEGVIEKVGVPREIIEQMN